jgi:hypothetical protein
MTAGIANIVTTTGVVTVANTIQYMGTATGADTLVVTPSPALTAYTKGMIYIVQAAANNTTTTPTVNISSLGAITIVKRANTALAAADQLTNMMCFYIYDGTHMQLLNPVVN